MTFQRSYGSKRITRPRAKAALTNLLYFCAPERLRDFTAEELSNTHNVPLPDVEQMLAEARRARG